jgi:hypothetical protein
MHYSTAIATHSSACDRTLAVWCAAFMLAALLSFELCAVQAKAKEFFAETLL